MFDVSAPSTLFLLPAFSLSHVGKVGDGYLSFGKLGYYLQLPAHGLDVGPQAGNVHIGPLLQLGHRGLVHLQQLRYVPLGQRPRPAKLVQRHLGEQLPLHLVDAPTAQSVGLVNRVAAPDALDNAVDELAGTIAAKAPVAVRAGKQMFYRQLEMGLSDAYAFAGETMACNMMADDTVEGIDAFIEKRKPVARNR